MKRYISAIIMLVALCSLAVSGRAKIADKDDIPGIPSLSPEGHEPIRASIIKDDPAAFVLDVRKFANIGVDEAAQSFAIYIGNALPGKCGDFRDRDVPNWAPIKYRRTFDFRGNEDMIRGLNGYGCIVIRNTMTASTSG